MTAVPDDTTPRSRVRHYADILNPLFDMSRLMRTDRMFEFVCALVRTWGLQGPEWDAWHESQAMLDDLRNLADLELPKTIFQDPERTRVRLSLMSYCHLIEMDLPYELVANLLRIQQGKKYDVSPFRDLANVINPKTPGEFPKIIPPSPGKKIRRIIELAEQAKLADIGTALQSVHDSVIRNAVAHSDYTIADGELRLVKEPRKSKEQGCFSQVVSWAELNELFADTFAFYTALFSLYDRCVRSFGDFKNAFLPYDAHYKGVLQLVFDREDRLAGFRVYWPNGTLGESFRTQEGSAAANLRFDSDGSVNFFVGLYSSKPSRFSPLVDEGGQPVYAPVPGSDIRPHWPEDLKFYKLPSAGCGRRP